ncbi:MAG: PUA domain-containing protein [Candidatus Kariarchaeaceae archaeon]|jgi:PUA domain protein
MSHSKHHLSGKDRKKLIKDASSLLENPADFLPRKTPLMRYTFTKTESLITTNIGEVLFLEIGNNLIPSIKLARKMNLILPKIVVDLGAIKFVTNGADIMRPGITEISDDVLEGNLVVIVEERKHTPLAFGNALYDAVDMRDMKGGKCIKNLHWLKDKWFEFTPDKK